MKQRHVIQAPGSARGHIQNDSTRINVRIPCFACSRIKDLCTSVVEKNLPRYAVFREAPRQQLHLHSLCQQIHIQRAFFRHIKSGKNPLCKPGIIAVLHQRQQIFIRTECRWIQCQQTFFFHYDRLYEPAGQLAGAQIEAVPQMKIPPDILVPLHIGVSAAHNLRAQRGMYQQLYRKIGERLKEQRFHTANSAFVYPHPGDAPAAFRCNHLLRMLSGIIAQIVFKAAVIHAGQYVNHRIGAIAFVQPGSVSLLLFFFRQTLQGIYGVGTLQNDRFFHTHTSSLLFLSHRMWLLACTSYCSTVYV